MKYAVGEFLLIVAGILVALQIQNWNEDGKDRLEEREVLQRIRDNVVANEIRITAFLESLTWAKAALEQVEVVFEEGQASGDLEFLTSVVESSYFGYSTPGLEFPAYEELVSSGKMGLIESVKLRDLSTLYYRTNASYRRRGEEIRNPYSLLTYDLIPRSGGVNQLDEIDAQAASKVADTVISSELHRYAIPQRNRFNFLERNWIIIVERGNELLAEIEAELTN